MIKFILIQFFILFTGIVFNGCDDNDVNIDFKTGLNCRINYGQGDCMPLGSKKIYNDYSGKVYIVRKEDFDKLIEININCNCIIANKIDSLKRKSISLTITNGRLIRELQPDSFLIMLDAKYTTNNNIVYLNADSIETRNLYFFNCTSY